MTPCYRPDKEQHRLQVIESDLKTLEPKVWLNDTVISYFIREFIEAHKSTYNFDGQFFGTILMNYKANKRNMGKPYVASCGITANFPYETYPTILVPVCMDVHWSFVVTQNPFQVKKITYKVKAHKTKPHQDNTYDCGIFMLYFMREVNRAIMRAKGNIILPLSIANICALPKQTRDHFNCDLERMEFFRLFRNDQAVQSEIANR
ncbi:hypothetical protein PHYSODRAFT_475302 [Phytophthora sojae]|uniref:Ubiquitin-like protease family profile domain-containing protein n=1 Tax=Phytophthora sojae (strain P6497) TaxID=1094619 RepID=G4YGI5_PHYSP|nr:hypothetical protein PHYSODRAFT_475302 [Phytophthora sojae]EGZ26520.1 hypothetical protein PHYSODRAFT_475302 [Phytophthora sojae]|eukprot:XP_009513795.1 hypothetical protein PHYSODRAFT_475302 [Phytophthora sojae]